MAGILAASGCGSDAGKAQWRGADGAPANEASKGPVASATITAPAEGATNVPTAIDIAYTSTQATSTTVELIETAAGTAVEGIAPAGGDPSAGVTWTPGKQLKWGTQYTAKVTATGADGKADVKTSTFTTMAKPGSLARTSSMMGDGGTYGVGMPVIINFGVDVAKEQRAAVQKRLLVTSEPPQEGVWNWMSAKEVHFRPKVYWQKDTKIKVRAAVGGLSFGGKWYGEKDVTVDAKIGSKLVTEVDNKTKMMTVTQDGVLLRTIPVSLGKSTSPSASGHMLIMIKNEFEWFDSSTYGVPVDSDQGYRTKVYWPQRITWDGEYYHAAPWSEGDQGKRNVSHGCTNISMANAEWLWHITKIGDPAIVKNTEEHVKWGNGWTDWDKPWEEYVKGSAIPYVAPTTPAPTTSPSDAASPTPSVTN
jgi:lipoprotein-anchoring transpeptidase ErfK/SrfK